MALRQLQRRLQPQPQPLPRPVSDIQQVSLEQHAAAPSRELDEASIRLLNDVLRDSYAQPNVREHVLTILGTTEHATTDETLRQLVDRPDLEGSSLQHQAEQLIRDKRLDLHP